MAGADLGPELNGSWPPVASIDSRCDSSRCTIRVNKLRPGRQRTEQAMILVLRFLHIVSGIFWVGGSLFAARFLIPSLKAAGPAAGPVLAELGKRRISTSMMGAALVNVAS